MENLPEDITRHICSYLDTDSDLYYARVMSLFEANYEVKMFSLLRAEIPVIFGIPRYLNAFKTSNDIFRTLCEQREKKEKTYKKMNKGDSFTTEWIMNIYH